jgi:hypothetical protein
MEDKSDRNFDAPSILKLARDVPTLRSTGKGEMHLRKISQCVNSYAKRKRPRMSGEDDDAIQRQQANKTGDFGFDDGSPKFRDKGCQTFEMDITATFRLACMTMISPTDHNSLDFLLFNASYGDEYRNFLFSMEQSINVKSAQCEKRRLRPEIRTTIVDWIVQICAAIHFTSSTLYLVIDLFDRILQLMSIENLMSLRLVAVTCVLLAGKFQETRWPSAKTLQKLTKHACKTSEIIAMERMVASKLEYRIHKTTVGHFVSIFCKEVGSNVREMALVHFLLQIAMVRNGSEYWIKSLNALEKNSNPFHFNSFESSFSKHDQTYTMFLASEKAAAALYLARQMMRDVTCDNWSTLIHRVTGYTTNKLEKCCRSLHLLHASRSDGHLSSVLSKFDMKQCNVGLITALDARELHFE